MKRLKLITLLLIALFVVNQPVFAVPTFQVYSPQGTAGSMGSDCDTWFVTDSSFELIVAGAFKDGITSLTNVTLLVSVPNGQTGTITISGDPADPLTVKTDLSGNQSDTLPLNPIDDATLPTNGPDTGFDILEDFIPIAPDDAVWYNHHYPLTGDDGEDISDFLIYDIGDFENDPCQFIHNYNADPCDPEGVYDPCNPDVSNATGQLKTFTIEVSGFDRVHFDVYGLVDLEDWKMNPGSHDTTYVPAPGSVLLGSIGIGIVGWLRRRRTL